jgi:hypothetical protein
LPAAKPWPGGIHFRPAWFDPGAPQSPALRGNGDIDGFINAYLTAAANGEIRK